jgi:uncharacterized protein
MPGARGIHVVVRLALSTVIVGLPAWGCDKAPPDDRPVRLRIATGPNGGTYLPLGEELARIYTSRVGGMQATAHATGGSIVNVGALHAGTAEVAFTQADVAYDDYTGERSPGPRSNSTLRAMAALYTDVVQIMARRDGSIRSVPGLAGRRVAIGPDGSGTERAANIIMRAHGLDEARVDRRLLTFEEAARELTAGKLDAAFVMASPPTQVVARASETIGIRLLSLDAKVMSAIRTDNPFYFPVVIPRGTYTGQTEDVHTLGVDNVLACRADLDERLVYRLTAVLLDARYELGKKHPAANSIDPEQAPATHIPLHPGAKRFYRTREIFR